jgi:phosphate transport system protein
MARMSLDMLRAALDAFVNHDPAAARALPPRDKQVDAANKQNTHVLAERMMEDPGSVMRCLHLITVSRSLERIADHATNVAEEVVYLYEAQDIRHTGGGNPAPAPTKTASSL